MANKAVFGKILRFSRFPPTKSLIRAHFAVSQAEIATLSRFRAGKEIILLMLLRRDHSKRLVITENSKDNITNLVHNSPNSGHFSLGYAFIQVILTQYRIFRFSSFIQANGLQCQNINTTPSIWRATF